MPRLVPVLITILALAGAISAAAVDPLPRGRDGEVKAAILAYLAAVTDPANPDFVPVAERIAVLDNDGTLWCEEPEDVATLFQVSLLRSLADAGLVDAGQMPLSAWLGGDREALREYGLRRAHDELTAAFAGMPAAAYRDSVRAFLGRARHPVYGVRYTDLYYPPMLELARLLEARDFQVWISTGAEQDFARVVLAEAAGIPPERVIGTWTRPVYTVGADGSVALTRGAERAYNGHAEKPANLEIRIGRRPILAAGNSDNDEPMCRWTLAGEHRALALWIDHDDPDRESVAGQGDDRIAALAREHPAVLAVSMRRD